MQKQQRYYKGKFLLSHAEEMHDFRPEARRVLQAQRLTHRQRRELQKASHCDHLTEGKGYCITSQSAVNKMILMDEIFDNKYVAADWDVTHTVSNPKHTWRKLHYVKYVGNNAEFKDDKAIMKVEIGRVKRSKRELDAFRQLQSTGLVPLLFAASADRSKVTVVYEYISYSLKQAKSVLMGKNMEDEAAFDLLQERTCDATRMLTNFGYLRTDLDMTNMRFDDLCQPVFTSLTGVLKQSELTAAKWEYLKHISLRKTCSRSSWFRTKANVTQITKMTPLGAVTLQTTLDIHDRGQITVQVVDIKSHDTSDIENTVVVRLRSDYIRWNMLIKNSIHRYPLYELNGVQIGKNVAQPIATTYLKVGLLKAIEALENLLDANEPMQTSDGVWCTEDNVDLSHLTRIQTRSIVWYPAAQDDIAYPRVFQAQMVPLKHLLSRG